MEASGATEVGPPEHIAPPPEDGLRVTVTWGEVGDALMVVYGYPQGVDDELPGEVVDRVTVAGLDAEVVSYDGRPVDGDLIHFTCSGDDYLVAGTPGDQGDIGVSDAEVAAAMAQALISELDC